MAGQAWEKVEEGGYWANPTLSEELREAAQPLLEFGTFVNPEPGAQGKGKGDTHDFLKVTNLEVSGGELEERKPMRETKFTTRKDNMTITEWGNSVPWTGKLEALGKWDPRNPVMRALQNDQAKVIDKTVASHMKACGVWYVPMGTTGAPTNIIVASDNTAKGNPVIGLATADAGNPANATRNLMDVDVKAIRDLLMDTLLVPPFEDGYYVMLAHTRALRGIKDSPGWEKAALYGDVERLYKSEVGRYEGFRFIEVNNRESLYRHGVASSGVPICGEAIAIGRETVSQGTAIAPEMRYQDNRDFGRSMGMAWYGLMGYQTTWRFWRDGEARAVWVTSHNNTLTAAARSIGV